MQVRVILVEDEPLFRELLEVSLSMDPDISVEGVYSSAAAVLAELDSLSFDVAILDIQIDGEMNGHELGLQLRRRRPDVGIVLLSNFIEYAFIHAYRRRSMSGWSYLMKDSVSDVAALRRSVKGAMRGEIVLDSRITDCLHARKESRVARLTEREREILALIAAGYTNRSIAERINIANKSVENAINRIYDKMGIDGQNGEIQPRVSAVLTYLRETRAK